MRSSHLRLVAIDGLQVAPAPKRLARAKAIRQEREIQLATIKEHLGHLTHSLDRLRTLTGELETSLGIALPEFVPHPFPDLPAGSLTSWSDPHRYSTARLQRYSTGFHHDDQASQPLPPFRPGQLSRGSCGLSCSRYRSRS
jgi:hypothetical protein